MSWAAWIHEKEEKHQHLLFSNLQVLDHEYPMAGASSKDALTVR